MIGMILYAGAHARRPGLLAPSFPVPTFVTPCVHDSSEVRYPTPGAFGAPGWKGVCRPWVQDLEKVFDLEGVEMTPNTKFRVSGGGAPSPFFRSPLEAS